MGPARLQLLAALLALISLASVTGAPISSATGQRLQVAGPDPELKKFTRAGCDNFTGDIWQPLRPAYHITVPYGWMNDPHGMFELNGTTHVFMQYNPRAIAWGAPFWGHVFSKDLAYWTWLPPALLPDQNYDYNGVWSGAATVTDGGPVLTYTAAGTLAPEAGNFWQRQAMAVPANLSDPLLKKWVKPQSNPFLLQVPPGGTNFQFRDPTEGRHAVYNALTSKDNPRPLPQDHYALAIGVQTFCLGGAGIFTAPDMAGPWTYRGSLFNQIAPEPDVNGQCMASRTDVSPNRATPVGPAFGGPCDQFGARCHMWEVVDMAELENGVYFLKWNDQSHFRDLFSLEWYVLGNGWEYSAVNPEDASNNTSPNDLGLFGLQFSEYYNGTGAGKASVPQQTRSSDDTRFNQVSNAEESAFKNLFTGKLDGQLYAPMRVDFGSLYASMAFRTSDRRQILLSWIFETAAGCTNSCSDELPAVVAKQGFKGALTMPRVLNFDPLTKTLRAYPDEAMHKLRGKQLFNSSKADVKTLPELNFLVPVSTVPGWVQGANNKLPASQTTARQFEIQANFTLTPAEGANSTTATAQPDIRNRFKLNKSNEFAVGVRIEFGNNTYADAYIKGSLEDSTLTSLSVWIDKSQAGGGTNTTWLEGGPVPLPADPTKAWNVPSEPLQISVWVDHSVIEVFAMRGLGRISSRVYPEDDSVAWGASAWAVGPEVGSGRRVQMDAEVWEMKSAWLAPDC